MYVMFVFSVLMNKKKVWGAFQSKGGDERGVF